MIDPNILTCLLDESEAVPLGEKNTGHCLEVVSVAAHPFGKIVAAASIDCFVPVFVVESNNTITPLDALPSEVWKLQFDPRVNI